MTSSQKLLSLSICARHFTEPALRRVVLLETAELVLCLAEETKEQELRYRSINACITLLGTIHGNSFSPLKT
ncbi:MAG: hypothetical protein CM15mP84_04800 [Cellvibrionales bacterium]|nr:MAG: hypothetical protein CM15mP84_04800 [Cellvibrionales bacterium]